MKEFNSVEEVIEAVRGGKIVVVMDDEDRENEGDVICAAEFATPENVNFMASYAKGLICMPMHVDYVEKLGLDMMCSVNTDNHGTAFTESIDYKDTTTGISAFERSMTAMKVVEDGAEYASIIATPAQTNNPYNWSTARFELRQKYVKNINRKDGAGTNVPQEMINPVTPKISFYFTDGEQANYDGMAVMYRDMLIDQGVLTPTVSEKKDIPLLVEFLGADKKENFLWNTTEVFTTASEAAQIIDQLSLDGINNVDAVYRCYTKNNEAGAKRLRALGQQEEFEQLETVLKTNGGQLFYYLNPTTANEDQITLRTEAANTLSNMEISWTDVNAANMYPKTYLYRLKETEKRIKKTMGLEYADAFAVDKMSNTLYGDFTSGKEIDRAASLQEVHGLVQNLAQTHSLALYQPNQYLWQYTEKMFNLPSTNSQLLYESDSVPFLQIVLSGCQELFSSTINTSSYSKERLLRQIEYGMAPSFTEIGRAHV